MNEKLIVNVTSEIFGWVYTFKWLVHSFYINTYRFVSTYNRVPIIIENDRLQMIQNIKCVDVAFIDDNEYVTEEIINKYSINKVIQAVNEFF